MKNSVVKKIEKSELKKLEFYPLDVLFNAHEKRKRLKKLQKAKDLRKQKDIPVPRIVLACKNGIKKVEAEIMTFNNEFVYLENEVRIPLRSVIRLDWTEFINRESCGI